MPSEHSIYSASASARLLKCSAGFELSKDLPREESEFAAEGTKAHDVCEQALLTGKIDTGDAEMAEAAWQYLREVNSWRRYYNVLEEHVERRLVSGTIEGFGGTADCVIIGEDDEGHVCCHVIDFKYGIGVPVDAENNAQLMSYAVLAAEFCGTRIDYFRGTIVQPRCGDRTDYPTWKFSRAVASRHRQSIIDAIKSETMEIGDHCTWCAALAICPAQRKQALELANRDADEEVPVEELQELFLKKKAITAYLDKLEGAILGKMEGGMEFPGLKAVSKWSPLKWQHNEEEVLAKLETEGVPESDVVKKKLRTPTQLKAAGHGDIVGELADREHLGHKIVPVTARGNAVDLTQNFSDFFGDN